MTHDKTIKPVAYIKTDFKEKFGIPRQSGRCPALKGEITVEKDYAKEEFFRGIEKFTHLWLIFGFSANEKKRAAATVRPPRLGGNERVGVFASRAPFRPNGLGLSCVKLEKVSVNENGVTLTVSGADLLDGTPIYDIKPYIPSADKIDGAYGGYSEDFTNYALDVIFPEDLLNLLPCDKRAAAKECLKEDPRPSYQNDGREYGMLFSGYDVKFIVDGKTLTVTDVKKRIKE